MNASLRPKVSVVIPTYNRSDTIDRALQSVLGQTFRDYEIVLVDDGSTDDTVEKIRAYSDERIRLIVHEKNGGEGAARNTGVQAARGEYFAFLDSDDEWLPDKLDKQVARLDRLPPQFGGNCTGFYLHLSLHEQVVEFRPKPPASWLKQQLMGNQLSIGSVLLARTSVMEKVGAFDPALIRFTDGDWLIRFFQHYRMDLLDEPLANIYVDSIPSGAKVEESTRRYLAKHDESFLQFGPFFRRKVIGFRWLRVAEAYFREGRYAKGLVCTLRMIKENPLQRPGSYCLLLDAVLGTSLAVNLSEWKKRVLRRPSPPDTDEKAL